MLLDRGLPSTLVWLSTVRQIKALGTVDRMFSEKVSGKRAADRAQLQSLLAYLRDGDTVRVKSPDRLARSSTEH